MGHLLSLLPGDDPVGTHVFDQRCSKLYQGGRVQEGERKRRFPVYSLSLSCFHLAN